MEFKWVADKETKTLFIVPVDASESVEEPLQLLSDEDARQAFYAGFNVPESLAGEMKKLLNGGSNASTT